MRFRPNNPFYLGLIVFLEDAVNALMTSRVREGASFVKLSIE